MLSKYCWIAVKVYLSVITNKASSIHVINLLTSANFYIYAIYIPSVLTFPVFILALFIFRVYLCFQLLCCLSIFTFRVCVLLSKSRCCTYILSSLYFYHLHYASYLNSTDLYFTIYYLCYYDAQISSAHQFYAVMLPECCFKKNWCCDGNCIVPVTV